MVHVVLGDKVYHFGLKKKELTTMVDNGYMDYLSKILEKKDLLRAGNALSQMLTMSYICSTDLIDGVYGRNIQARHSADRTLEFASSEAYRVIFNEVMVTGYGNGRINTFMEGVTPGKATTIELGGRNGDDIWKED